uniref:Uncharacterized protein n=1 Tax=Arundo donax TaxID=35708 RepID=A0A0A9AHF7_ARUDO
MISTEVVRDYNNFAN